MQWGHCCNNPSYSYSWHPTVAQILQPINTENPRVFESFHCAAFFMTRTETKKNVPETAEASALLQRLCKHFIFANVVVTDGATGKTHGLFKVILPDLGHGIVLFNLLKNKWIPVKVRNLSVIKKRSSGTEPSLTMAEGLVCLSLSLRISLSMLSLIASLHARWQISVRSAPEKPLVIFARKSRSTSY